MGLDIYLYTKEEHEQDMLPQDVPSKKHPNHLFNRRYLRSSYNQSGFNSAVPDFIGKPYGLYWIFEPLNRDWDSEYDHKLTDKDVPALNECMNLALSVADLMYKSDRLRVHHTNHPIIRNESHFWSDYPTEQEVLNWYRDEVQKKESRGIDSFNSYSTAKGTVFGFDSGLEILAITLGRSVLNDVVPIIVYRAENLDPYIQSAEIVAEFCDEAITLIERDGEVYISWSG